MVDTDKVIFLKLMQATLAIYDKTATQETVRLWWNILREYPIEVVESAFSQYLKTPDGKFSPKPASIIEIIDAMRPDGRPGADEAWAMIPKDEQASAVMSNEMAEALHIAQPLLDAGDKIGARMAFKEAYTRIVEANKMKGAKPSWFPSLGQDKEARDAVLAEAVRLGRLSANHAIGLLPPDHVAPMLQAAGHEKLALEHKMPSAEEVMKRIHGLKEMLAKGKHESH